MITTSSMQEKLKDNSPRNQAPTQARFNSQNSKTRIDRSSYSREKDLIDLQTAEAKAKNENYFN